MNDTKYEIAELAKNSEKLFSALPEVVITALKTAGMDSAAVEEAKKIVKDFLEREVN